MVIVLGHRHGDPSSTIEKRMFVFHIALIPLGKTYLKLFSLQLFVHGKADNHGNRSSRRNILNSDLLNSALKNDLVSHTVDAEANGKYMYFEILNNFPILLTC